MTRITDKKKNDKMFFLSLNVNVSKNHKKHKHGLLSLIVKLLTITDKKTGQVHLALTNRLRKERL